MAENGTDPDTVDEATRAVDEDDAQAEHTADRMPTDDEVAAAERAGTEVPETVADAYQQSAETGAKVKGEGEI